jgi:hypothetical protein
MPEFYNMVTPKHELIPLASSERWNEVLAGFPHSFSHTWEYCQAMFLTTGYPTYLYRFTIGDKTVLCVFCERGFQGTTDIVSPYGFNGFIACDDCPEFNQHWKLFLKDRGYVCGYIGLNPLTDLNLGFQVEELFSNNEVFLLDLTRSEEEIVSAMSRNRRRQIKKASLERGSYTMDKEVLSGFFLDNFSSFMKDRKASSVYQFSRATLKSLVDSDHSILVGYLEGETVVAVTLFGYTNNAADSLFNVSTDTGKKYSLGLQWMAILQLQALNIPVLNLGGGIKSGDTVAEFKEKFGAAEKRLIALRQVYNHEAFEKLCKSKGVSFDSSNYFPPYR